MLYVYIFFILYYFLGILWFVYINFNKTNYIYIPNKKEYINDQ